MTKVSINTGDLNMQIQPGVVVCFFLSTRDRLRLLSRYYLFWGQPNDRYVDIFLIYVYTLHVFSVKFEM